MTITRRKFIRQVIGYGSACLWLESAMGETQTGCGFPPLRGAERLVPGEPRVMPRLSAAELDDPAHAALGAKLREAVCAMKALPREDVNGWAKLPLQHCSITGDLHYSGHFLPWHRAWLYLLERKLRKLSGDDDLRLPYWDWETLANRGVPSIFAAPDQCLFDEGRDYRGVDMKDIDVLPLLAVPNYRLFGGGAPGNPGAAFSGPNANVHNAFRGDMANLSTAPNDPLLYAHLANIDRLWSSWTQAGHSNPDFGTDKVYFYDENRRFRYMLLNDLTDDSKLGYRYASPMTTGVHLKEMREYTFIRMGGVYTTGNPVIEEITGRESEASYLIIRNIGNLAGLPRSARVYGVFADKPNLGWTNHMDANYLGKVADVPSGGARRIRPLTCALNVSDRLVGSLRRQKGVLRLLLSPLDEKGRILGPVVPLVADSVTVLR